MSCSTRLTDGHGIIIEFFDNPDDLNLATVQFWEISVTPPGIMGGGANRTSTMRNTTYHTKQPKSLIELSDCTAKVSYHPEIYESILEIILVNKWIRITWPDGNMLGFWGWLDEIKFGDVQSGEQPEADITIICSNQDTECEEAAPVYEEAAT